MDFGKRFWKWISSGAVLEIAAMQKVGVLRLTYSDRYLLQAYTLGLLHSVLRAAPGGSGAQIQILSARANRPPFDPRRLFDSFLSDPIRSEVQKSLLPTAAVSLLDKQKLPHYRLLTVELQDRRQIRINLDQGFGWWQVAGAPFHDFEASAASQARSLAHGAFDVLGNVEFPVPVTVLMQEAPNA